MRSLACILGIMPRLRPKSPVPDPPNNKKNIIRKDPNNKKNIIPKRPTDPPNRSLRPCGGTARPAPYTAPEIHRRTDKARPGPAVDGQRSTPGGSNDTTVQPVAGTGEPTYSKAGGEVTVRTFSHIPKPRLVTGGGGARDASTVPELRSRQESIGAAPNRVKPARDSH